VVLLVEVLAGFLEGQFARIGYGKEVGDLRLHSILWGLNKGLVYHFRYWSVKRVFSVVSCASGGALS
jgi:hypothetical protein